MGTQRHGGTKVQGVNRQGAKAAKMPKERFTTETRRTQRNFLRAFLLRCSAASEDWCSRPP